jgi:hypothetical protein
MQIIIIRKTFGLKRAWVEKKFVPKPELGNEGNLYFFSGAGVTGAG